MHDLADVERERLNELVKEYYRFADRIGIEHEIKFKVGKWYTPVDEY